MATKSSSKPFFTLTKPSNLYKAGVYPRFPIYYFGHSPEAVTVTTDLVFEPTTASPESLEILGSLDRSLLGYRRDVTHTWLLGDRQGYVYYRDDRPVGYGYVGARNGPFALIDDRDFPAVLAHAESECSTAIRAFYELVKLYEADG